MLFSIIRTILLILEVITCLALIVAVLLQKTKSQGMGLAFGSGMGESLFGAQVGNVMTKITIILATIFLVNTAVLAMMGANRMGGSSVTEGMPVETGPVNPVQYPQQPIQPQPVSAQPPASTLPATPAPVLPPMPDIPTE